MFKKKPVIQVLKVRTETRDVINSESATYGYMGHGTSKKKTTKNVKFTIVLLSKDGELCTREFNGEWNLSDIKKWEDL